MLVAKRAQLPSINFHKTYLLSDAYQSIKDRTIQVLGKYLGYPDQLTFNDLNKSITFSTERLIPTTSTHRLRVMLLFSNPHPYSVHQGMFLSPNTKGRENLFWPVMEDAGWLSIAVENRNPKQLAEICLKANYPGPFELIFYCYYAFPTHYPADIRRIFGQEHFSQVIEPEAIGEFKKTIQETSVDAVITFNKGIFNLVAKEKIDVYVERLVEGHLIQSQIKGIDRQVPIFLTFPTGWHFRKHYRKFRKDSLVAIRKAICSGSGALEIKN